MPAMKSALAGQQSSFSKLLKMSEQQHATYGAIKMVNFVRCVFAILYIVYFVY